MLLHSNIRCKIPDCSVLADFTFLIFYCPDNRLDGVFNGKASKKASVPRKSLPELPPLSAVSDPSQFFIIMDDCMKGAQPKKSESWVFATCGGNDNSLIGFWGSKCTPIQMFNLQQYSIAHNVIPAAKFLLPIEWLYFFYTYIIGIINIARCCEYSKQHWP